MSQTGAVEVGASGPAAAGAMRATLGLVDRIARELRDHGSYTSMTEGALSYAEVNAL